MRSLINRFVFHHFISANGIDDDSFLHVDDQVISMILEKYAPRDKTLFLSHYHFEKALSMDEGDVNILDLTTTTDSLTSVNNNNSFVNNNKRSLNL